MLSLPVRGAWIEILPARGWKAAAKSLPVRGAWIEIAIAGTKCWILPSLPVRGAWIEIPLLRWGWRLDLVAPRAGSVD